MCIDVCVCCNDFDCGIDFSLTQSAHRTLNEASLRRCSFFVLLFTFILITFWLWAQFALHTSSAPREVCFLQFPTYLISFCCLTFVSLFCLTKSSSNLPKPCESNTQACFSPLLLFPTLPHPPLLQISRLINRCSTESARQRAAVAASKPLSKFLVPGKTNKTHIKFRFLVFRCYYFTFTLYGADVYHSFSTPFFLGIPNNKILLINPRACQNLMDFWYAAIKICFRIICW